MDITDRFTIRNKFLFYTGFLIFIPTTFYSNAKNDNSYPILFLTILGCVLMFFGFRKPKEKTNI